MIAPGLQLTQSVNAGVSRQLPTADPCLTDTLTYIKSQAGGAWRRRRRRRRERRSRRRRSPSLRTGGRVAVVLVELPYSIALIAPAPSYTSERASESSHSHRAYSIQVWQACYTCVVNPIRIPSPVNITGAPVLLLRHYSLPINMPSSPGRREVARRSHAAIMVGRRRRRRGRMRGLRGLEWVAAVAWCSNG